MRPAGEPRPAPPVGARITLSPEAGATWAPRKPAMPWPRPRFGNLSRQPRRRSSSRAGLEPAAYRSSPSPLWPSRCPFCPTGRRSGRISGALWFLQHPEGYPSLGTGLRGSWRATRPTRCPCSRTSTPASVAPSPTKSARTRAHRPRARLLPLGMGSCRDLATLLVEAVRSLGFGGPRRFRLPSRPDHERCSVPPTPGQRMPGRKIFLPGAGWITFDPTNRKRRRREPDPSRGRARHSARPCRWSGASSAPMDAFLDMAVEVSVE